MKNRFLSLLITLIMVFSLSSPAFAQEPSQELLNRNDTRLVLNTSSVPEDIAGVHRGAANSYSLFSKAINITTGLNLTFNDGSDY